MGIYYYLFSKSRAAGICLGKRGKRSDSEFDGPVVFIDGARYLLPEDMLQLLVDRFKANNGADDVVVVPDFELFDGVDLLPSDADYTDVGGDVGPPLSTYLPEIEMPEGRAAIVRAGLRLT